jgi:hypothetical protein
VDIVIGGERMLSGMPIGKRFTMVQLEKIRMRANEKFPNLNLGDAEMYPHDGGVEVKGKEGKQWVSFPGRDMGVRYDWSLWKILNRLERGWE